MTGHAKFSPQKFRYICEAMRNQYCHFNFPSCGFTGHNLYEFCFLVLNQGQQTTAAGTNSATTLFLLIRFYQNVATSAC